MPTSLFQITKTTLLALTAAAILAGPGHTDPLNAAERARILQGTGVLDVQALNRSQRRREFQQQQQQQLREQVRQSNQRVLTLEVPVFRPSTPVGR